MAYEQVSHFHRVWTRSVISRPILRLTDPQPFRLPQNLGICYKDVLRKGFPSLFGSGA